MAIVLYYLCYFILLGSLLQTTESASVPRTFDFIIVGAGATGSVIGARLAKETDKEILVIEGGARGSGQSAIGGTDFVAATFVTDPATGNLTLRRTPLTRYDVPIYADTIRSAANVLNNTWGINAIGSIKTQTRVVGGNSASNGMAWLIPYDVNFDAWNISGYSGTEMRQYFKRIENATDTGYLNSPRRGYSGPINVVTPTFYDPTALQWLNASVASGFPIQGDGSAGLVLNGSIRGQANNRRGVRDASPVAYLAPALATQRNLELWPGSTVTRVLFDEHNQYATGVEYVDEHGAYRTVNARVEVILAAGCLMIPKILYNSGIGPASILNAFGKPHVVVNELIGQKIRSQQRFSMSFVDPLIPDPTFYATPTITVDYASTGGVGDIGGIMASTGGYGVVTKVKASHPVSDVSIGAGGGAGTSPTDLFPHTLGVTITLQYQVYANSTINLTSSDPLANSLFTANILTVPDDVETLVLGVFVARDILKNWGRPIVETFPGAQYNTTAALYPIVQANGDTNCHYAGSTPIGNTPASPLDPRMRVRGVERLRVAGPAINPGYVSSGMQALAYALGEKATDLIKEDYGL